MPQQQQMAERWLKQDSTQFSFGGTQMMHSDTLNSLTPPVTDQMFISHTVLFGVHEDNLVLIR